MWQATWRPLGLFAIDGDATFAGAVTVTGLYCFG